MRRKFLTIIVLLGAAPLSIGCSSSPPSRFYRLVPLAVQDQPRDQRNSRAVTLGVGPISIPGYLDKPQMVDRVSATEVRYSEFNRWSQKMKESFTQVLAENLSSLLLTDAVYVYPFERAESVDYQVIVNVLTFDGSFTDPCRLEARWLIRNSTGGEVVPMQKSVITEAAATRDHAGVAAALSTALLRLSQTIASTLDELPTDGRRK